MEALSPGHKALKRHWVYKAKKGPNGEIMKFKVCWVIKGYKQKYGIDYIETFTSMVKPMSYKALFALAAALDYKIEQMDFITAFLNGSLKEIIHVEQFHGFELRDRVCHLLRALCGLKQSPRVWYKTLYDFLVAIGFTRTHADHSIFTHANGIIITVYIDDLQIFGLDMENICLLKKKLTECFNMIDLGPATYYLGIQIT